MPDFISEGLQELWVRYGAGIPETFIPVHFITEMLGNTLCKIVYKAHVLSSCDITSQVGSKTNVLKVNPGKYLMEFGESCTLQDSVASDIENYLVITIQPKSECTSSNQLRYMYHMSRKTPLVDLPPTSHSIQMHILCYNFVVHQGISLIKNSGKNLDPDPAEFGWYKEDGYYKPIKKLSELPSYFYVRCCCKMKCTERSKCSRNDTVCTEYCKCKGNCTNN